MKTITVLQSSLRKSSNTAILSRKFAEMCDEAGFSVKFIDLRNVEMEFCDGRAFEDYPKDMQNVYKIIEDSDIVIIGMPVYNYSMSGVLKNFIDICGKSLTEKPIGLLMAAGGQLSYMAGRDLQQSLLLQYKVINLSPFVYAYSGDFGDSTVTGEKVLEKMDQLLDTLKKL